MTDRYDEKTLTTTLKLPDRMRTAMVIPTSSGTYFNTQWKAKRAPLCAYDMLYHPPDYNPKAARTDRQEPQIIRRNIWDQGHGDGISPVTAAEIEIVSHGVKPLPSSRRHILTEFHKGISSTSHFKLGRPKWPILDRPTKLFVRVVVKNENPHMRLHHVLEWAALSRDMMSFCYT